MKKLIYTLIAFIIIAPDVSHAGMQQEWKQIIRDCKARGGTLNSEIYNNWDGKCNVSSGASSPSTSGNNVTDVVTGIISGNSQQMGRGLAGFGVSMFLQGLQGNPAQDAAVAAAAARQAAELQRLNRQLEETKQRQREEAERKLEATKQRLLGELKGVEGAPQLSFMNTGASSELKLITVDQADQSLSWEQYKAWEKHKQDVIAYQEEVTKKKPKNKGNEDWCKSRIPLSTGANRINWEARCSPDGLVPNVDSVAIAEPTIATSDTVAIPEPKTATSVAPDTVTAAPELKQSAVALAGPDEAVSAAAQGGFDSKDLMLGEPENVPETPKTFPVGPEPETTAQALKDPAVALAGPDETVSAATQGGFDSKDPMLGKPGIVPNPPETFPIDTTPVIVTAANKHVNVPATPKETPSNAEHRLMTRNQTEPTSKLAPNIESSTPSQKAVAEKQSLMLSCAIRELQGLASGPRAVDYFAGEEKGSLNVELNRFLNNISADLSKPCSGQSETHNVQTITLSTLTSKNKKEDQLVGNVIVTRDEKTCEVRLSVLYESLSSRTSRSPRQSFNESQSVMRIDKTGNIIAAETPAGVEECLARLSTAGQ